MTQRQSEVFEAKQGEWTKALETIGGLDISEEWQEIFTALILDRCFRRIGSQHTSQMMDIASTNSEAVKYLAMQDKKAGLETLWKLSEMVTDEQFRARAVSVILTEGIRQSKNELDAIIAMASSPGLFSQEEVAS